MGVRTVATGLLLLLGLVMSATARAQTDYRQTGVNLLTGRPADHGFRMPAEWSRHERTVMAFPNPRNWTHRQLPKARREWAAVARAIARFEPVTMLVNAEDLRRARELCGKEVQLLVRKVDSGWHRDHGPFVLTDDQGARRSVGFVFNAWGKKDLDYRHDRLLSGHVSRHLGLSQYAAPLVLEGGSVTVDGQGTLIAVETSILNPNRNPGVSRAAAEKILRTYLGVTRIIWLPKGLEPDPFTDGHVDGICVFVRPGVVMLQTTDDPKDRNYEICRKAARILRGATDARGRKLEILSMPLSVGSVNFYVCNGGVIASVYGDPEQDAQAVKIIQQAFPRRKVVPVRADTIEAGGGGIHCITQQIPAGKKAGDTSK